MVNFAEHLLILSRSLDIYDEAPSVAQRLYKGSIAEMAEEFRERIYPRAKDPLDQQRLGCAYNYALIKAMVDAGQTQELGELLGQLSSLDEPLWLMDTYLKEFGTSYRQECLKRRELLVPRTLDQVLFERFAPESIDRAGDYHTPAGLAVLRGIGGDRYKTITFKDSMVEDTQVVVGEEAAMYATLKFVGMRAGRTGLKGSRESVTRAVRRLFSDEKDPSHHIVFVEHDSMPAYLGTRFLLKKTLGHLKDEAASLPAKHGFQEFGSEKG